MSGKPERRKMKRTSGQNVYDLQFAEVYEEVHFNVQRNFEFFSKRDRKLRT